MFSIFENQQGYPAFVYFSTAAVLLVVAAYVLVPSGYKFSPKSPKIVSEGYPIFGALRFFTARWEFFQHARAQSPSGNFSFFLGKHPVVGLSGDKGRQLFFESRELGFAEGFDYVPPHF